MDIITEHKKEPVICTIFGEPGLGKTTLAATFPNPIFIMAEDGLKSINPRPHSFPLIKNASEIFEQLKYLRSENHDYKTLVIDSISQLDSIFAAKILADDPSAKSFNSSHGGYGSAPSMLAAKHGNVRKYCEALRKEKNMNVVFIGHCEIDTIAPPDCEPYSKYELKISKKSYTHYVDNVDLVGMIKLDIFVNKERGIDSGERVLICHAMAANISKNRFAIDKPITIEKGKNPLEFLLK